MRLIAYYILHTVINTFKKLFKTWIAILIVVCLVVGVVIGLFASALDDAAQEKKDIDSVMSEFREDLGVTDETAETVEEAPGFLESHDLTRDQMIEGIISIAVLAWLLIQMANADGASKIFTPADVPLLFASPMKPQSVMLFRLVGSMGLMLFASVYLLAQIPNLIINVGLNPWGAVSLILCYTLLLITGMLFKVTFYTIASRHPWIEKHLTKIVLAIALVILAGFAVFAKQNGGDLVHSAALFFAGPTTRFVPFWGWMRGFCMMAIAGEGLWCAFYAGLLVLGYVGLVAIIWNLDADFYEDAMEAAERLAAVLESSKTGVAAKRQKDRSEKLKRDGFRHGSGASVFFFKSMYNRFRFSSLGLFTKTLYVYLGISLAVSFFCKQGGVEDAFVIVACCIGFFTFYRTLGNPLREDTSKAFFTMIPEPATKKLLWSLLAGSVNCLMDIMIPIVVAAIWLGAGPASAVMWMLLILSIDFFGTTVGTFINISLPDEAGASIKTAIQIMFIYFGILPAAGCVAAGIILEEVVMCMSLAIVFDLIAGFIFFALTPRFLENGNR